MLPTSLFKSSVFFRKSAEIFTWLSEETEKVIRIAASLLGGSFLLHQAHHFKIFVQISESVEHGAEYLDVFLKYADVAAVGFLLLSLCLRFFRKNPNRVWVSMLQGCESWRTSSAGALVEEPRIPCMTRFPDASDINLLSDLNHKAFDGSTFEYPLAKLKVRNRQWISKNPYIFQFAIDPEDHQPIIGYTALLPLNEHGADMYNKGLLHDSEIPHELISAPEEQPACILVFALALRQDAREGPMNRKHVRRLCYLYHCLQHHLYGMYSSLENTAVPLLAQAERHSIKQLLKKYGFKATSRSSADECVLWELADPLRQGPSLRRKKPLRYRLAPRRVWQRLKQRFA